ncbi:WcbI family polysaccharide biosynthesis putative acetyltransferase [Pseudoalteromonas sp. NCIMB_1079]|uniref:WcbI family polysaccharide biosynthesis putative acetyltransferase n=1 Tax=Pseudoalteromonas sp. NCIMB 1079 TaxID=3142847 RepID=UPI00339CBFE8
MEKSLFTDSDITNIKNAGYLLKKSNPVLSYKLLSLASKKTPNDASLRKSLVEIKELIGITTFFVIGNCQAAVVSDILESKSNKLISYGSIAVHLFDHDESIFDILDDVDFIITQNVGAYYKGINTENLLSLYPEKVIRIHNLHFEGYHPDWCYIPKVNGVRLQSPLGDYHNLTVLESYIDKLPPEQAFERFMDVEYNKFRYGGAAEKSLNSLRVREKNVDIKMKDVIKSGFDNGEVLFHTFNHPTKKLLDTQVQKLMTFLNIDHNIQYGDGEVLNNLVMRTNPYFRSSFAIRDTIRKGTPVNMHKFIQESYDIYDNNQCFIDEFRDKVMV